MRKIASYTGLGRIASEVLLRDSPAKRRSDTAKLRGPLILEARSQAITDQWLREAIQHPSSKSIGGCGIVLSLPIVLKTLQKLRTDNRDASYFALMNKINSTNIKWMSNTGRLIVNDENVPLELFHETSMMLYKMSNTKQSTAKAYLMAKFTLGLMVQYKMLAGSKKISNFGQATRFYRNCILIVTKAGSISHLLELLKIIPDRREGLKILAELAFLHQSSQEIRAFEFLEQKLLDQGGIDLNYDEVLAFFPLFFSIMQASLFKNNDITCCKLLKKMSQDWNYSMDSHDLSVLVDLMEKNACTKASMALKQYYPDYPGEVMPWKILQSELDWEQYLKSLCLMDVDLFVHEQNIDFLQFKLSSVGPGLHHWKNFLEQSKLPDDANESIRAFYVHSVLSYLASNRNLGFVISILEYMIYEMNYTNEFMNGSKIKGQYQCSNFHILFKAISKNSSALLTADFLFRFLVKRRDILFSFNANDFYHMMKSCTLGTNYKAMYYFLYQCILVKGSTFYRQLGDQTIWSLPGQIEMILQSYVYGSKRDRNGLLIANKTKNWFMTQLSTGKNPTIDSSTLIDMFAENYVPEVNLRVLRKWEKDSIESNSSEDRELETYSPTLDMSMCKRLSDILNHVLEPASDKL